MQNVRSSREWLSSGMSLVDCYRKFGWTCCFHLQGRRVKYLNFTPLRPKKTIILKIIYFVLFQCRDCGEFNTTNESVFMRSAGLLSGFCSFLCNYRFCTAWFSRISTSWFPLSCISEKLSWSQNETGKWFSKHRELPCLDTEQISILANSSKSQ
jgi:hypothetical protein